MNLSLSPFTPSVLRKIYKHDIDNTIMEMVTIPKEEFEKLKMQANIDIELLKQLIESFKDIKEGKIRRVK